MLRKLTIENYVLIEQLEIDFSPSLNIITGETGAGKSILLGALGLLLGSRSEGGVAKDSARNCVVEGVFDVAGYGLEQLFADNDLEFAAETIIRRVISPGGKSRAYVNDLPVLQWVLKEVGQRLIDIHSQHQSLLLADDGFRTALLDSVAGHGALLAEYKGFYHRLRAAEKEHEELAALSERSRQDEEWLRFQVEQLRGAQLKEGESERLEQRQSELSHAGEIEGALSVGASVLGEDETGVLVRLRAIEQGLNRTEGYCARCGELAARVRASIIELKDLEREFVSEADRVSSDPGELEAVSARLGSIYSLMQKHRVETEGELIALGEEYAARLDAITDGGERLAALSLEIDSLRRSATDAAARITEGRRAAALEVSRHVEAFLGDLGMLSAKFTVGLTPSAHLRPTGADEIRFYFSANKNMAPAPAEKIASGGEMSRLMLALKSLAAKKAQLPTIIFDEIDSGVSGKIADVMGDIIQRLSETMQVVNITHLPQVASKGTTHFHVRKEDTGETSRTVITRLSGRERVDEIAKMISGSEVTDAARAQARLLLQDRV